MKQHYRLIQVITILSIFFLGSTQLIINPALQDLSRQYADIPYTRIVMLATIPNLMVALLAAPTGRLAGKKVDYKTLVIVAGIISALGGALPFFLHNFQGVFATRVLFGVGVGIATPLGNAIIMRLYEGNQRATMIGLGSTVMCGAGIIYQALSGYVTVINVKYFWLVHLVVLVPVLLTLFFLPDMKEEKEIINNEKAKGTRLPASVYWLSIGFGMVFMCFYPLMLNMSSIVAAKNIGDAATAGTILTMYTVGGMIGGLAFGYFYRIVKDYALFILFGIQIIGLAICNFTESIALLMCGTFLNGLAVFMLSSTVLLEIGRHVTKEQSSAATGMMMAIWNFGTFSSTLYMSAISKLSGNDSPSFPVFLGMIFTIFIGIIWSALKRYEMKHRKNR